MLMENQRRYVDYTPNAEQYANVKNQYCAKNLICSTSLYDLHQPANILFGGLYGFLSQFSCGPPKNMLYSVRYYGTSLDYCC